MKIGITANPDYEEGAEGKGFKYEIHFRTSNGVLQTILAGKNIPLTKLLDHLATIEQKVSMIATSKEVVKENFLEDL